MRRDPRRSRRRATTRLESYEDVGRSRGGVMPWIASQDLMVQADQVNQKRPSICRNAPRDNSAIQLTVRNGASSAVAYRHSVHL
jgi:hypothetical protein